MSNELTQLFPTGKEISINDENLTIKPFKFGELPKVFKAIGPLTSTLGNILQNRDINFSSIAALIMEGGDSIIDLMVIGSRKPRDWVDELEMDQGVEVLTAIFEVNADFFIRKVLPLVNTKMEKTSGLTSS